MQYAANVPAVRDRVAQEVLRRLLSPIFEARFHDHSFGFRPGRSCHDAVEKVLEISRQGYRYVLDADISGFFDVKSRFVRMRAKSVENFKAKVRGITQRSHNLDAEVIVRLNRVIRGTANYFATPWSHCGDTYRSLDRWIRMRLRSMKYKRKSPKDNPRFRLKYFRRMGLLSLSDLRAARIGG